MRALLLILAAITAALHTLGTWWGVTAVLPWAVGLRVVLAALPTAFALWLVGRLIDRHARGGWVSATLAAGCGVALVVAWPSSGLPLPVSFALLALTAVGLSRWTAAARVTALAAVLGFGLMLLAVHDLNYLLLAAAGNRLRDPALRTLDLWAYGWFIQNVTYDAIFPIVKSHAAFRVLENGYVTLSFQPLLALLAVSDDRRSTVDFLRAIGCCYLVAGATFLIFPAIGPMLSFPASFDTHFSNSLTHAVTVALHADVVALRQGLTPVSGLGYFIALPSIHAAVAMVCQVTLWRRPTLFWMLLPMNVLLLAATFLLGQHYIVDTVAGALLGVGAARWCSTDPGEGRPHA